MSMSSCPLFRVVRADVRLYLSCLSNAVTVAALGESCLWTSFGHDLEIRASARQLCLSAGPPKAKVYDLGPRRCATSDTLHRMVT
jgi:hypothetical protein